MFGGAYSGTYSVQIRHNQFGLLDTSGLTFTIGSDVTSFSPNIGSIYGGQLITIDGTNWSTDKRDNPVSIVFNGALGASQCNVVTTSATQITCRIEDFAVGSEKTNNKEGKLVVFLKTSEEAQCQMTNNCKYIFTDSVPQVTAMIPEWDAASNAWTIKLTGTAFSGTTQTSELSALGLVQEPVAIGT